MKSKILKFVEKVFFLLLILSTHGCEIEIAKSNSDRKVEYIPESELEVVLEKDDFNSKSDFNKFDTNKKTKLGWYYEFRNGEIMKKAQIKEKIFHGKYWSFYNNDQIKTEGHYIEGKKNGLWRQFFSNGEILNQGQWNNDIEIGEWIMFDSASLEREVRIYDGYKGNYTSTYWNKDGKLISETSFKMYKKNGIQKTYNENGHLINQTNYINEIANGEAHEWVYENDSLLTHTIYDFDENGKREGWAKFYDSNKNLMFELLMKEDSVIKENNFLK